jgi:hypothetical protein
VVHLEYILSVLIRILISSLMRLKITSRPLSKMLMFSIIPISHRGDVEFTIDEVGQFGILDALKSISSDTLGFDGVFLKFLNLIAECVIDPLTRLVNYSLSTSCFSKHWKKSVLTPIPKKRSWVE